MKQWFTLCAILLLGFSSYAQTARVQVIHNSPTPGTGSGPVVDIYVNGALLAPLTAVPFRAATSFLDVPSDVALTIDVKVSPSAPADPAVATFPIGSLADGGTYVVTAAGIVGDPTTPFNLYVNASAIEAASNPAKVDLAVFHGSPDAPAVDVDARLVGNLIEDLAFGDYQGYLSVDPGLYYLDIRPAGNPAIVATFAADLSGLAGGAATVFASGLLGGMPSFGVFAALPDGTVVEFPQITDFANVNFIYNSPGAGAEKVDVYINGGLVLSNFAFRTATGFIELPPGIPLNISVASAPSSSVADAIVNFELAGGLPADNYIFTMAGRFYDPTYPFTLQIQSGVQQESANPDKVLVVFLHSSPGAPAIDVDARANQNLFENLAYGSYEGYFEFPAEAFYLDIRVAGSPDIVATYLAPLFQFDGQALVVFASGILGGSPAFGLFAADADGNVYELESFEVSRTQIIHNSPSPTVDIYLNGDLAIPALAFRDATPYIFTPANTDVQVKVVPAGGDPATQAVFDAPVVFGQNGQTLVVMATGIAGNMDTPFTLNVFEGGRELSDGGVDVLLYHGSTDAPEVDVVVDGPGIVLFDDIAYGNFSDDYVNVPAGAYILAITPADDNSTVVIRYEADLTGLEGGSAVAFASGFFGGADPGFGVWVALPNGVTFPLPVFTATNEVMNVREWNAFPNPVAQGQPLQVQLDMENPQWMSVNLVDASGKNLRNIFQGQLPDGIATWNVATADLSPGMYFLNVVSEKGVQTLKVAITR